MSSVVTIVDYGTGNLLSVARALEHCGATVRLSTSGRDVETAERLLLPGVGSFRDGIDGLRDSGQLESIAAFARSGRPFLGICLGMQLLATESHEFGVHAGLGLLPGTVMRVPTSEVGGRRTKTPIIGWAQLEMSQPLRAAGPISEQMDNRSFYLVHSYHLLPDDPVDRLAYYRIGHQEVTAAIMRDNILGCQFHPEKSGISGIGVLSAFLSI